MRLASGLLLLALGACQSAPLASGADRDLFVVRHAQAWSNLPEGQRGGRQGEATDSLTPEGVRQAEQVAEQIAGNGVTVVFHSPRGRARETAEIIAKRCGVGCALLQDLEPMRDGESVAAAARRALTVLSVQQRPGNWAFVSHSGVTSAVLGEAAGTPAGERLKMKLPTGGMRRVRWLADGSWQLR